MRKREIICPLGAFGMVLCVILVLTLTFGHAQIVRSSVVGTIRDATGAVIPGVTVTVTNLATNVSRTVVTDDTGNYVMPFLDPGQYRVAAQLSGFKTAVEPRAILDVATKLRVDLTLQLGETTEEVEVRAAVPLIETDSTTVGLVLKEEQIKSLPLLDRNYQALTLLAPTAVEPIGNTPTRLFSSSGGNYFQAAGQRGEYISYNIDGIDANQLLYQTQSIIPSLDTIQEFKVQTHNFSAEYGRGTIQFTTTTKSGTNRLHGTIYEYDRNAIFNANNFFNNRIRRSKDPFNLNQFGANVGGPIYVPKVG